MASEKKIVKVCLHFDFAVQFDEFIAKNKLTKKTCIWVRLLRPLRVLQFSESSEGLSLLLLGAGVLCNARFVLRYYDIGVQLILNIPQINEQSQTVMLRYSHYSKSLDFCAKIRIYF